jgi:uncharacterized sulfatase
MGFSRREFLAAAAFLPQLGPKRPNILFVIADDQSYPHASAYGDKIVRTPAFDRIAAEGVRFTQSYCAAPSCTPSRSAVLSGRHVWQTGEGGVLYGAVPRDLPLFPHLLEEAGYITGFTGKGWGPGDWKAAGLTRSPTGREYNQRLHATPPREGLDRRDYAANFADFLKGRPANKPFCFWFGPTEPHRVYARGAGLALGKRLSGVRVPAYWPDHEVVRGDILDYYAEIEWYDAQLGKALDALAKTRELDDTLIIATSDNGMPFPRCKVNVYDPGVHMPLAVRWGARVKGGRRIDDFVSHVDFAPTILEAAGVTALPGIAGRSLLPLLDSGRSGIVDSSRDRVFTALERHTWCRPDGATYPIRAMRTRDYLYVRNFAPDRWPTGGPDFISSNLGAHGDVDGAPIKDFLIENRSKYPKHYELCFGKRPGEELYHVASDPDQVRNLAADPAHRQTLHRHREELEAHLRRTGDPRIDGQDPWQGYTYRQTGGYGASFNRSLPEDLRRKARALGPHKPE